MVIALAALTFTGCDDEEVKNTDYVGKAYIELVRDGYPVYLEDKVEEYDLSYGKVFSSFFDEGKWEYFKSEDWEKVVEYNGVCTYDGEDADASVQFTINEDEESFNTYITLINDEEYDMEEFIETVFDDYMEENRED